MSLPSVPNTTMPGGAGSYSQAQSKVSAPSKDPSLGGGNLDGPSEGGPRQNTYGPGLGYDPAKPVVKKEVISNTRVELPPEAYRLNNPHVIPSSSLPERPGLNSAGKTIAVRVNQYKVLKYPTSDVWQYAFMVGNGAEKRGLIKKAWESRTVQGQLKRVSQVWLWDGNALAWCSKQAPGDANFTIDFDAEAGRPPRTDGKKNTVEIRIKCVKPVRMAAIQAYLAKKMTFDESVLDAINFMDHLLREWPASQYHVQKRSFFNRAGGRNNLDNVVEAMKGVYSSIRLCDPTGENSGLAVNVDVANGTFWISQALHQGARNLCNQRNRRLEYNIFRDLLLPQKDARGSIIRSEDFHTLERMKKLKFTVKHRGRANEDKVYSIKRFTFSNEPKYFSTGVTAKTKTFLDSTGKQISVFDYYLKKYNITLNLWQLPLVETERDGFFPMELCTIVPNQKYPFKLSPDQTSAMIKFAVTRPAQRIQSINAGISMLKWDEDPNLKHFGTQIDTNMALTQARLLQPPEVHFAGPSSNAAKPGTSGKWDLRGKKFLLKNSEPLSSWGIVTVNNCVDSDVAKRFMAVFVQSYIQHGGDVKNKNPAVIRHPQAMHLGDLVAHARREIMKQCGGLKPQIIFFALPGRDNFMYERLKKNMECRFACVSQMLNVAHVNKAQPQYCSNVCMKVNAKLGGTTAKAVDSKTKKDLFTIPTMIIGADVSHPSPGSPQASMAAVTMSYDRNAMRYCAAVETNGARLEMITRANWKSMLIPLFKRWVSTVTNGSMLPQHIYYFRDGVSEGQYQQVLDQEVKDIKECIAEEFGPQFGAAASNIKFTVTICAKRHHVRFFPKEGDNVAGDRNGNPLPGTLVERDVTHPFEYDFYLSSHSAIQGTARPVHYHVIMDEAKVPVNDFQRMIYQHCYQYMRSTTPVSLFPAVYYAHLASNRARSHEDAPASAGPRGGQKFMEAEGARAVAKGGAGQPAPSSISQISIELKPLIPMGSVSPTPNNAMPEEDKVTFQDLVKIRTSMWYI